MASVADSDSIISDLKAKLREKEQSLVQAATYGKGLLEENMELRQYIGSIKTNYKSDLEKLSQQMHQMKSRNDLLNNERSTQIEELETVTKRCQVFELNEVEIKKQLEIYKEKIEQLVEKLQNCNDGDARGDDVNCLKEKETLTNELSTLKKNFQLETCELEEKLCILDEENKKLINDKKELVNELTVKSDIIDHHQRNCASLTSVIESLNQQLEEKECKITSYSNALERSHQEVLDLKVEMQAAEVQQTDLSKRGNSLFSELDDRRQALEHRALDLKEKCAKLAQENSQLQTQVNQLNLRIVVLSNAMSDKVDASYAQQLEIELETMHREVDKLRAKVLANDNFQSISIGDPTKQDLPEYRYLNVMLTQARERIIEQEKEKNDFYYKYTTARDEAQKHRRLYYDNQRICKHLEADNLKLRSEISELQINQKEDVNPVKDVPESSPSQTMYKENVSCESVKTGKPTATKSDCKTQ